MTSELDPRARALIGLALKGEQRLPRDRDRVRRRVLTAVAAPTALGAAEAAAAGKAAAGAAGGATVNGAKAVFFATATWLKAVPLVAVGVAASVGGLMSTAPTKNDDPPSAVVSFKTTSGERPAPIAVPRAAAELPQLSPEPPAPAAPLVPSRGASAARHESPVPPSLAADLDALQRAQRTLNAGNAAGALRELRAVRGRTLRAERTALEVFANCALGNLAVARQQAALFRQLAPQSPLLTRVEASCATK